MPLPPSTLIWSPGRSRIARVAAADDGEMLSSRATTAAWDRGAPTSVTTAAAPGEERRPADVGHRGYEDVAIAELAGVFGLLSRATPWARPGPADGGSNRPPISAG